MPGREIKVPPTPHSYLISFVQISADDEILQPGSILHGLLLFPRTANLHLAIHTQTNSSMRTGVVFH